MVFLVLVPRRWAGAAVSLALAFLWAWLALAYHLAFFTSINPLAYVFSGVSLVGALIFLWQGVIRHRLKFAWNGGTRGVCGAVLIAFAIVVYPVWSSYTGHVYPAMPTFGLPCPTAIFTIGVLSFLVAPYPRSPLFVPVLWCIVGTQAAISLSVLPDLGLIVAGAAGVVLAVRSTACRHSKLSTA